LKNKKLMPAFKKMNLKIYKLISYKKWNLIKS
jgi:hypothetical protein